MLKGFVSGEEKDIVRIPMKGKNLLDYNVLFGDNPDRTSTYFIYYKIVLEPNTQYTMITNVPNYLNGQCPYMFGTQNVMSAANDGVYSNEPKTITSNSDGSVFIACRIIPNANPERYITKQDFDNGTYYIMLNLGSTPLPYEPYGYQEGWEVRDNQDRLIWGREDELQTATGTLPFKGYSLPVKVKSLLGNTVQNGTPAPYNIVMPEMCGVRTGNLHNPETDVFGFIDPNGNISSSSVTKSTDFIPCESGSQYVLRVYKTGTLQSTNQRTVDFYASDKSYIDVGWDNRVKYALNGYEEYLDIPFVVPTGAKFLRFSYDIGYSKSMLNLGSTALPYEPYGWKIPLTNAGQTIPVYLGEVPTVRRVRKLVLDGTEEWGRFGANTFYLSVALTNTTRQAPICSHFVGSISLDTNDQITIPSTLRMRIRSDIAGDDVTAFKTWLAAQYAAGTPVTIWYVLATEQTTISNEPLCKISTYADELTTIQVHGLSAPLYGIGDYKDTLNLSTGVVTRKIGKVVLTGNEAWIEWKGNYYSSVIDSTAISSSHLFCTHFINDNTAGMNIGAGASRLKIASAAAPSVTIVTDLKAWLADQYQAGTPVTIWYILETPETETVTVPTGMSGEIEGYLTQVSTPTPTNRSVPKWNGVEETGGTYAVTVYTPPEIPTTTGENTLTVETEKIHGLTNPLCGIGDYKDVLNLSTGVITRKVKKLVLTASGYTFAYNGYGYYPLPSDALMDIAAPFCDKLAGTISSMADAPDNSIRQTAVNVEGTRTPCVTIKCGTFASQTEFNNWLTQYTPTIWYVLAESETETITVPYGLECSVEGYLTQSTTPAPSSPITPDSNGILESDGTYAVEVSLVPSNLTVKGHIKELT